jgi:hypothetical protein
MEGKRVLTSITEVCGAQGESFVKMKEKPCEHFDQPKMECKLLQARKIPDMRETERCQSIVMYYAKILSKEQWEKDGRVTDHEYLPFDDLFDLLHDKSMREFEKDKGQRYEIGYWHGYIKRAVRNAILKKIEKAPPIVRDHQGGVEAEAESEDVRLEKKTFAQSSFAEKKDGVEDALNARVDLSMLVSGLTEKIRNPGTSEKEKFLCMRRRTLIINLLHLIRRDKPANEACVELRRQRTQDKAERERFRSEMKYDREALMDFFLQKKTMNP